MIVRLHNRLPSRLGLLVVWSIGLGYSFVRLGDALHSPLRPMQIEASWITGPEPTAFTSYFRTSVLLPAKPKHGWLVVAARNSFEVTVNRNPVGRIYLWRPTRPYQNGTSDPGQRIVSPEPALALNFPREYQWIDHDNTTIPLFIDISEYLVPGKNVITVQVEARHIAPSFVLEGAAELWSGQVVPLSSGPWWRAEPVPPGLTALDWTERGYDDSTWRSAKLASAPTGPRLRTFDPRIYKTPFQGHWLVDHRALSDRAVDFETDWILPSDCDEAYLRVLANRPFEIAVHGEYLGPTIPSPLHMDRGHWIINERRAWDPIGKPELLDPDEVGSMFVGEEFLNPRHADPTYDPVEQYKHQINLTPDKPRETNRSELPGEWDPKRSLQETKRPSEKPERFAEHVGPKSLSRDRSELAYYAYNVGRLLRPGRNRVRIRLTEPDTIDPLNFAPRLAIDGEARLLTGQSIRLGGVERWKSRPAAASPGEDWQDPVDFGPALDRDTRLPRLTYRGAQVDSQAFYHRFVAYTAGVALATLLMVGLARVLGLGTCRLRAGLIAATTVVALAIGLDVTFYERDEHLAFLQPWTWMLALSLAGLVFAMGLAGWLDSSSRPTGLRSTLIRTLRRLPETTTWVFLIAWVLLLAAFLRLYKLDYQPLDDDEYASVQAVLAIARTGAPEFEVEGVYYSRSPLYHYLAAVFVFLFGENLWALRGPVALFGVGTCWLTYRYAEKILRSPWVGLGAMLLLAVHPYVVFTGHVARFYQQQQFFAILTAYWFCRGFVTEQNARCRELTVWAFLGAVLSQEITMVLAPSLALGFLIFGKDLGTRSNLRLAVSGGIMLAWIFLDWLAFQTLCLTRTEGVSPNLEATVKPHLWQVFTFGSMFVGYSRLHLLLSAFPVADLVLRWRTHNRAFIATCYLLLSGIALTVVLVTHSGLRYQYYLFPLWLLVGVEGIRRLATRLSSVAGDPSHLVHRPAVLTVLLASLMYGSVLLSWSLWRMPGSYDLKILPDSTGAFRYVATHMKPDDHVLATEPHPHAGILEIGRIDYDLSVPRLHDFLVLKDGKLVDRNGGAVSVGSLSELMDACRAHDRLWILIYKEKFRTRGKNLRWEYPGTRIEEFLRQNLELKHRTHLWYVYLWDRSRGRLRSFSASP